MDEQLCPHCHGQGELEVCSVYGDTEEWSYRRCSWCRGRGLVYTAPKVPDWVGPSPESEAQGEGGAHG